MALPAGVAYWLLSRRKEPAISGLEASTAQLRKGRSAHRHPDTRRGNQPPGIGREYVERPIGVGRGSGGEKVIGDNPPRCGRYGSTVGLAWVLVWLENRLTACLS
jgi:hypothetical protein